MGDREYCSIWEQDIEFSSFRGVIEDIQTWTTHQTWTEGGGGYVHPRFGGYVQAPSIHSHSEHHIRVRVGWETGGKSTIDLPGSVHLSVGDHVQLLSAENHSTKIWRWVALVNLEIERFFILSGARDVAKVNAKTVVERFGLFFSEVFRRRSGGRRNMKTISIVTVVLSLVATIVVTTVLSVIIPRIEPTGVFILMLIVIGFFEFYSIGEIELRISDAEAVFNNHRALLITEALNSIEG